MKQTNIKRNTKKKKARGFSLVELIIVIAIMAILAAVSTQVFTGLNESSARTVADANATALASTLNNYQMMSGAAGTPLVVGGALSITTWAGIEAALNTAATTTPATIANTTGVAFPVPKTARDGFIAMDNVYFDATTGVFRVQPTDQILVTATANPGNVATAVRAAT